MSDDKIGTVKGGRTGKFFDVSWNGKEVYVKPSSAVWTWTRVGTADSVSDAMRRAEAHVYAE